MCSRNSSLRAWLEPRVVEGAGPREENINIWAGRRFCVLCAVEIELGERPFLYPRRSCWGSLETG